MWQDADPARVLYYPQLVLQPRPAPPGDTSSPHCVVGTTAPYKFSTQLRQQNPAHFISYGRIGDQWPRPSRRRGGPAGPSCRRRARGNAFPGAILPPRSYPSKASAPVSSAPSPPSDPRLPYLHPRPRWSTWRVHPAGRGLSYAHLPSMGGGWTRRGWLFRPQRLPDHRPCCWPSTR